MYSVILSNRAIKDLTDIVEYIGADNPDAAEKTGFELVNLAMSLDYMPYRGSKVKKAPRCPETRSRKLSVLLSRR
jgi:plasmid stabilization system protein ParE